MIIVNERKTGNQSYYIKKILDDEMKVIISEEIHFRAVMKEHNNMIFMIIYDDNMVPIQEAFDYLNYGMQKKSINTRGKHLHALKFLFSYQKIRCKKLKDFTVPDIYDLRRFLRGYSYKGQFMAYEDLTERNAETVNGYLAVYRSYLKFIGEKNECLYAQIDQKGGIYDDMSYNQINKRYDLNERTAAPLYEVPMYISPEEFSDIRNIIRNEYTYREECIVRLMFEAGLRLGEVLGLTNEDVLILQSGDGSEIPVCFIRNRVSDKSWQKAKTCMEVTNKRQYVGKEYNTCGYGYQIVILSWELYDFINNYIEESRKEAIKKNGERCLNASAADSVKFEVVIEKNGRPQRKISEAEDNFYIFLNSLGRPLSRSIWNMTIREIMGKAGLYLDTCRREHNLNHRFRHGFAMFQVLYLQCPVERLAKLMRHSSITSVRRYYNPTLLDTFRLYEKYISNLYDVLPELKRPWD